MMNEYNTNDLMFGRYVYNYKMNINGGKSILIAGERMGVLFLTELGYYDLIGYSFVAENNILMKRPFNARDNKLDISTIRDVFKGVEEICEYMATERQVDEDALCPDIPSVITFKASEMSHCLESMYSLDKNLITNENSTGKRFSKFKNIFKRK